MAHPVNAVEITQGGGHVTLSIRVVPGASRTKVAGVWDKSLRIAVAAPPEGGKANDELIAFLSKTLGRKRGDVRVVRGQTQRTKLIEVRGETAASLREKLRPLIK